MQGAPKHASCLSECRCASCAVAVQPSYIRNNTDDQMTILFQKVTVFSVLCPLLIAVGLPYSLYLLTRDSVSAIGGVYLLIAVAIAAVLWGLDRWLASFVPLVPLSVAEVLLLGSLMLWYSYDSREFIIDASANSSRIFIIAYTTDDKLAEEPSVAFPFGKKMTISDRNYVILRDAYRPAENRVSPLLKSPASWGNEMRQQGFEVQDRRFTALYIFSGGNSEMSEAERESAVKEFLARVKK